MAEEVSVTMFKAGDGSLHKTQQAAAERDYNNAKSDLVTRVADVVEKDFDYFADEHVKVWDCLEYHEKQAILDKVAELIVDNAQSLMTVDGFKEFKRRQA
jgi:delta 1-pyrroline-5-carboxylate dehydrogenase